VCQPHCFGGICARTAERNRDRVCRTADHSAAPSPARGVFLRGREGGRRDFDLFVLLGEGDDIEIALPADPTGRDISHRVDGALDTLAVVEGRPLPQIVSDIRSIGFDRISSAVPDSLVLNDSVHLEIAADHIGGMKAVHTQTIAASRIPSKVASDLPSSRI
jgi:hypothetical protein